MGLQFRYVSMSHQLKRGGKTRPDRVLSARQPGDPGADTTTEKSHEWSANTQRIVVLWPKPANVTLYRKLSRKGYIVSLEERQLLYNWICNNDDDIHLNTSSRHENDHDLLGRW